MTISVTMNKKMFKSMIISCGRVWKTAGKRQEFCGECGPRNGTQNVTEILDCFELFFDRNIIDLIVTETNRYAEQYMNARAIFSAFGLRFVNGHPSHLMKFILF